MVHLKPRDHVVVQSVAYAYGLLMTGDAADRDRGQAILRQVISTQDTRPNSAWRGVFPWRLEDKWETIKNPDLNSAVFVGSTLAGIINMDRKQPTLDADLRQQIEQAAKLSVEEVIHRDVEASYTNMALLSTSFAAAGRSCGVCRGRASMLKQSWTWCSSWPATAHATNISAQHIWRSTSAAHTAFANTPSPMIFAAKADAMIDHLWKEIALSYHAPTFQLAGPHNRS